MKWYIATVSFHHNTPRNEWQHNFKAKNKREALAMAFREAVEIECGINSEEMPGLDAFMPLNDKETHVIEHPDGGFIVMWNNPPSRKGEKRNIGFGPANKPNVDATYKGDNCWIELESRDMKQKKLAKAIKGYEHRFEKLPVKVLVSFLHRLDRVED